MRIPCPAAIFGTASQVPGMKADTCAAPLAAAR